MDSDQLQAWQGDFGDAYTDRNAIDWQVRLPAWRTMLDGLALENVVEVGCNRGHNLRAIAELGTISGDIVGIEPNDKARRIARTQSSDVTALRGTAYSIPLVDGFADLSFTSGVLIHIALGDLPGALAEIVRVSRRYVLAAEYYAPEETVIEYRGHGNLLWKRDFKAHYLTQFPGLRVVREGYWGPEDGFDRVNWWLFEK